MAYSQIDKGSGIIYWDSLPNTVLDLELVGAEIGFSIKLNQLYKWDRDLQEWKLNADSLWFSNDTLFTAAGYVAKLPSIFGGIYGGDGTIPNLTDAQIAGVFKFKDSGNNVIMQMGQDEIYIGDVDAAQYSGIGIEVQTQNDIVQIGDIDDYGNSNLLTINDLLGHLTMDFDTIKMPQYGSSRGYFSGYTGVAVWDDAGNLARANPAAFGGGGGGTPGGDDHDVQWNNLGSLEGNDNFEYDGTDVTIGNELEVSGEFNFNNPASFARWRKVADTDGAADLSLWMHGDNYRLSDFSTGTKGLEINTLTGMVNIQEDLTVTDDLTVTGTAFISTLGEVRFTGEVNPDYTTNCMGS
jgi:hypothetical protein